MMDVQMRYVLSQRSVPVIMRSPDRGQKLKIRLPFADGNRQWLKNARKIEPVYDKNEGFWFVPKAWFDDFVERALKRFGKLYVIQPYREQEKCSPACLNATGHECQCSCMGANHGAGEDGSWFVVSDTFATRWGEQYLACRLMKKR